MLCPYTSVIESPLLLLAWRTSYIAEAHQLCPWFRMSAEVGVLALSGTCQASC